MRRVTTATHCNNILQQHTAKTHCNTRMSVSTHKHLHHDSFDTPSLYICLGPCNTLPHTATRCNNILQQHTATHFNTLKNTMPRLFRLNITLHMSGALQHTATHCNTLQCFATQLSTLQQHTATTHCNNTLQHTVTYLATTNSTHHHSIHV